MSSTVTLASRAHLGRPHEERVERADESCAAAMVIGKPTEPPAALSASLFEML